ncbi:MAG: methionine sulfoxide reductase [Alphaproteobacteria bacterium]|nr:methionine sulfoxide reductase [Alphaproteobacteria bacterium]
MHIRSLSLAAAAVIALIAAPAFFSSADAGDLNKQIPAAAQDPANPAPSETAVLAGGCFWGQQGVFEHVKGVTKVIAGYSGGSRDTAVYEQVGTETTGHAESVEITFDPRQVSYATLLRIYFSVAHDPTQLNRQGPDEGTSYRSAIFAANDGQAATARAYIAQLTAAHVFPAPIATKIEPLKGFYRAESYHQDYLIHHPESGYIQANDLPKIEGLKKVWPQYYQAQPVRLARN